MNRNKPNLVLVDILRQLGLSQLVEGHDDQGDEDVDEEEREDDEVDDVKDGDLGLEPGDRALVLVRGRHGVLQDSAEDRATCSLPSRNEQTNTHATQPSVVCTAKSVIMPYPTLS